MTARTVVHDTFVIERTYSATPERVFAAWTTPEAKAQWFGGLDGDADAITIDFRVGGIETMKPSEHAGHTFTYDALFQDIVENERIVYTYEMTMDGQRISISVTSVEFAEDASGTKLIYTEQGAYLDGLDQPSFRFDGTTSILDDLAKALGS